MAEQKESSVLFSLKELMNLEEDRIKSEEDAKVSAQRQAQERAANAEKAKRDAEEARIRAEEEARRQEEQRRREEEARLEAIRHAEIEKARAEAEHRARMEAMSAQQAHEQQLAAMKGDKSQKKLKVVIGVVLAAFVLAAIGGFALYSQYADKDAKEKAALQQQALKLQEENEASRLALKQLQETAQDLEQRAKNAETETERNRLQQELDDVRDKAKNLGKPGRSGGGGGVKKDGKPACTCPPGDPLCSCL